MAKKWRRICWSILFVISPQSVKVDFESELHNNIFLVDKARARLQSACNQALPGPSNTDQWSDRCLSRMKRMLQ